MTIVPATLQHRLHAEEAGTSAAAMFSLNERARVMLSEIDTNGESVALSASEFDVLEVAASLIERAEIGA
jgi:hypothetical protein